MNLRYPRLDGLAGYPNLSLSRSKVQQDNTSSPLIYVIVLSSLYSDCCSVRFVVRRRTFSDSALREMSKRHFEEVVIALTGTVHIYLFWGDVFELPTLIVKTAKSFSLNAHIFGANRFQYQNSVFSFLTQNSV